MAINDVQICNMALSHLSQTSRVSSINPPDQSAIAGYCAEFYPIAVETVLERHAWKFATTRRTLASVTAEVQSWQFAYAAPTKMVRALAVLPPGYQSDADAMPFDVETQLSDGSVIIVTNQEDAILKYIIKVTDTSKFSPMFTEALSWYLAHLLAGPITKSPRVVDAMEKMYEKKLALAVGLDGMNRFTDWRNQHTPEFLTVRRG